MWSSGSSTSAIVSHAQIGKFESLYEGCLTLDDPVAESSGSSPRWISFCHLNDSDRGLLGVLSKEHRHGQREGEAWWPAKETDEENYPDHKHH